MVIVTTPIYKTTHKALWISVIIKLIVDKPHNNVLIITDLSQNQVLDEMASETVLTVVESTLGTVDESAVVVSRQVIENWNTVNRRSKVWFHSSFII